MLPMLRSGLRAQSFLSSAQAHKNCQNMTEIEAKVSYVKLARSLKTYGVSFFLVKVRQSWSADVCLRWTPFRRVTAGSLLCRRR